MIPDLVQHARAQADACRALGSELLGALADRVGDDLEADGPTYALLDPARDHAVPLLGLFGWVHRLALTGRAPEVAAHFPSTGGDGDPDAAWAAIRPLVAAPTDEMRAAPLTTPQTNEVGRSSALVGGFLTVARELLPKVRLLEVGSSAGLNLRFDRYRYEQGGSGWGPPDSPVVFADLWQGGTPPFDAPLDVVDRAGCDLSPIDPASEDGRLTLLCYVWPDQLERFTRLRAALDLAPTLPVPIEQRDVNDWLDARLATPTPGVATVVFHSLVWWYFPEATQAGMVERLERAGALATEEAPLAWLRLEPTGGNLSGRGPLRLTTWPGGAERDLAECSFHLGPITWSG
jgi:hypothetical protein